MKKWAVGLLAAGLFAAMPVLAAEHGAMKMATDEGIRTCVMQAETLQEKIARFKTEIAKGSKKYSAEELKKLEQKLAEANKMLDDLDKK